MSGSLTFKEAMEEVVNGRPIQFLFDDSWVDFEYRSHDPMVTAPWHLLDMARRAWRKKVAEQPAPSVTKIAAILAEPCSHCRAPSGRTCDRGGKGQICAVRVNDARRREKAAARNEDARRLAAGEVTAAQLSTENGLVQPGTPVKIVDYGAGPRRRR